MIHHGRASSVVLALALAIGLPLGGCATAPTRPHGPQVEAITSTGDAGRAEVVIQASEPLEYTAFRLSDPSRIVIDLPDATLGVTAGVHPSGSPLVGTLSATEVDEGPNRVARIEIGVDPSTTFAVTPDAEAKTLRIELTGTTLALAEPAGATAAAPTLDATVAPAADPQSTPAADVEAASASPSPSDLTVPAMAPSAEPAVTAASPAEPAADESSEPARAEEAAPAGGPVLVRNVTSRTANGTTEVVIEASAPIAKYEVFRLASPARLVLDIQDATNRVARRRIPVTGDPRVKAVRLGSHQNRVRVVLDLAAAGDSAYEVSPDPRGLVVTLGQKGTDVAKATPTETAAAASAETGASAARAEVGAAPGAPVDPLAGQVGRAGDGGLPAPRVAPVIQRVGVAPRPFSIPESGKRYTGRRISLDFKDADIENILRLIAEISNLNIVTGDDVKGKLSLRLINVPWDQALDIVLESQGLGMVRTGNVIRIAPAAKLKAEDEAALAAKAAKQKLEDLTLEIIPVNYADATEIEKQIKSLLSERGKATVDTRTNHIIVSDVKEAIDRARALVAALDTVTPQVLIEARIVEANLDFTREIGVQWGGNFTASAATGNPTGLNFPGRIDVTGGAGNGFAVNLPAAVNQGSGGAVNFTFGSLTNFLNLDLRLSALERTGEGRIISSPRITTLDNKEAVIQQGLSIPFETLSDNGTQTTFIDADLKLTVTPHVTNDESINLKIGVTKNAPDGSVRGASGAPSISKKEAKTEVLIKNGQTTVIGGIFQIDRTDTVSGVPWFQKLPFVGWLFKKTTVTDKKTELLIFITPRIVRPIEQQTAASR
ncbi:MAG TPA: type IV pilus secretin PilQ [Thermodesulfobacteriota bacterium]